MQKKSKRRSSGNTMWVIDWFRRTAKDVPSPGKIREDNLIKKPTSDNKIKTNSPEHGFSVDFQNRIRNWIPEWLYGIQESHVIVTPWIGTLEDINAYIGMYQDNLDQGINTVVLTPLSLHSRDFKEFLIIKRIPSNRILSLGNDFSPEILERYQRQINYNPFILILSHGLCSQLIEYGISLQSPSNLISIFIMPFSIIGDYREPFDSYKWSKFGEFIRGCIPTDMQKIIHIYFKL